MKKIAFIAAAAALLLGACERVESNNFGIESVWGQVNERTLPSGNYQVFTKSIMEVAGYDIKISYDDMRPKAKGNLTMQDFDVDVYYKILPENGAKLHLKYKSDVRSGDGVYFIAHDFATRQIREAIYNAVSQFSMETMHEKRPEIASIIKKLAQEEFDNELGKNWIKVESVNIRNIVTDPKMEESIRAIATQQFLRTQQIEEQKTQEETNKTLMLQQTGKANAEAANRLIKEKNDAERRVIAAKAEADANKLITESLTPSLLRFREIEMTGKFAEKGSSTILLPQGQTVAPMINTGK
jgi:regulator of protease activity HflC (stomatin/prohibitin superfamily)